MATLTDGPSWLPPGPAGGPGSAALARVSSLAVVVNPAGGAAVAASREMSTDAVCPFGRWEVSLLDTYTRSVPEEVAASTHGWSSEVRSTSTVIRPGPLKFALRRMFSRRLLSPRRTPAYSTPELPPKRTEMSFVPKVDVP